MCNMSMSWSIAYVRFSQIGERGGLGVFLVGRRSDIDLHVPASAQLEVELVAKGGMY